MKTSCTTLRCWMDQNFHKNIKMYLIKVTWQRTCLRNNYPAANTLPFNENKSAKDKRMLHNSNLQN